jgi:cation diffusion facilitator family transporter
VQPRSLRAVLAALGANVGIAIAKFVAFAFTGSASMLAEGFHSVADTSNEALLLLGGARAKKEPTAEHPFGHGRERYFWAFVVALVIFSLGSLFAMVEGVEKFLHPDPLESVTAAVAVLVAAMILEGLSWRTAIRYSREGKERAGSWWRYIRQAKEPELPVVLLEDSGALVGLTFALVGVLLAEATGNPRFDALGSFAIGLLLGAIAVILMIEMKGLLIGEAATAAELDAIRNAVESNGKVQRLIHLRTQHLGPEQLLVGVKIDFDHELGFEDLAAAIDEIEARIREVVPVARIIYVEPDVTRPA